MPLVTAVCTYMYVHVRVLYSVHHAIVQCVDTCIDCVLVSCEGTRRRLLSLARAVTARSGFSRIGSSRYNDVRSQLATSCERYQARAVAVTSTVDARQSLTGCCYLGNAVCQFSKISFMISATTYVLALCVCACARTESTVRFMFGVYIYFNFAWCQHARKE